MHSWPIPCGAWVRIPDFLCNLLASSTTRTMHHRDEALVNCNHVGSGGLSWVLVSILVGPAKGCDFSLFSIISSLGSPISQIRSSGVNGRKSIRLPFCPSQSVPVYVSSLNIANMFPCGPDEKPVHSLLYPGSSKSSPIPPSHQQITSKSKMPIHEQP
jgi:hypothetical protein